MEKAKIWPLVTLRTIVPVMFILRLNSFNGFNCSDKS